MNNVAHNTDNGSEPVTRDGNGPADCLALTSHAGAAERVREDMKIAADLGINGTPIFFLGVADNKDSMRVKEVLQGAEPIENFRAAIGRVLANLSGS